MIIAVNIVPQDTLKATLEETTQRLGRARRYAELGVWPVRVFGPVWVRESGCPVLQYRLANGPESREMVWEASPGRLFHAGIRKGSGARDGGMKASRTSGRSLSGETSW